MTHFAYYNEIDPFAAQWLRNLMAVGRIAPGHVDERSIQDVKPDDLREFTQCHFFAGIGVWSYALRRAGWPDDRPVWTGSCPCQPFSSAGAGAGFDDSRHLWPDFAWLIWQCDPTVVFGEQVASKDAGPWLDVVQANVEALGYAFGAVPFPAASVGAPHIRDRLYWVADSAGSRRGSERQDVIPANCAQALRSGPEEPGRRGAVGGLGNAGSAGLGVSVSGISSGTRDAGTRQALERTGVHPSGLADTEHPGHGRPQSDQAEPSGDRAHVGLSDRGHFAPQGQPAAGPVNGFWADADWLFCRDGKWRPVEPGTFPLVDGAAAGVGLVQPALRRLASRNRTGRLKGYGNAINAEAATAFISAYLETQAP